jgi:ribosomal protein S18 acetylase RimI-like enzyme
MPPLLEVADVSMCAEIGELVVDVYIGEGYTPRERAASLINIAGWAAHATVLVARSKASAPIVGVVGFASGGAGFTHIAEAGETEIQRLAVAPHARGRGTGCALVAECIERSRTVDAARVVLWTRPTMVSASRLYERMGFHRQPQRDQVDTSGLRLVYVVDLP